MVYSIGFFLKIKIVNFRTAADMTPEDAVARNSSENNLIHIFHLYKFFEIIIHIIKHNHVLYFLVQTYPL